MLKIYSSVEVGYNNATAVLQMVGAIEKGTQCPGV
jgi:hypothetical protein